MEDDLATDDDRAIELSSIEAIYPEITLDSSKPFHATLDIPVTPSTPLTIRFNQTVDAAPPSLLPSPPPSQEASDSDKINADEVTDKPEIGHVSGTGPETHSLTHLPPLTLDVELPDGYPTDQPPKIKLSTTPEWLPESCITALVDDSKRLWEENGRTMVVYDYINHLEEKAVHAFGLSNGDDGSAHLSSDLKISLLDYDIKEKRRRFENETFDCGICLEPKKGSVCHRLISCGHVFCVACLQDFFNACINEGDVDNVKCLSPDCGKKSNTASPSSKRARQCGRGCG